VTQLIAPFKKIESKPTRLRQMLLVTAISVALGGLAGTTIPAAAQDATYSAEEVTKHFKQLKTRSLKATGTTRALCIGTRDECNPNAAGAEGGQVAVTQENPDGAETDNAGAPLLVDPETKAIDDAFNLLVSFEYASARLSPAAKANLREFAKGISNADIESAKFVIEGHTDGIGSESYNQRLSEDRAQAVTQFLINLGVGRGRLKTVAYGESRPKVADINDPANRRVESKLILEQ